MIVAIFLTTLYLYHVFRTFVIIRRDCTTIKAIIEFDEKIENSPVADLQAVFKTVNNIED